MQLAHVAAKTNQGVQLPCEVLQISLNFIGVACGMHQGFRTLVLFIMREVVFHNPSGNISERMSERPQTPLVDMLLIACILVTRPTFPLVG